MHLQQTRDLRMAQHVWCVDHVFHQHLHVRCLSEGVVDVVSRVLCDKFRMYRVEPVQKAVLAEGVATV